jgi:hypothetical protein
LQCGKKEGRKPVQFYDRNTVHEMINGKYAVDAKNVYTFVTQLGEIVNR